MDLPYGAAADVGSKGLDIRVRIRVCFQGRAGLRGIRPNISLLRVRAYEGSYRTSKNGAGRLAGKRVLVTAAYPIAGSTPAQESLKALGRG